MHIVSLIQRTLLGLPLAVVLSAIFGPLVMYQAGLYGAGGIPGLPASIASRAVLQEEWKQYRGQGEPSAQTLNPYTYLFVANEPGAEKMATLVAWYVAKSQVIKTQRFQGMGWWHLSGAALTIWLTRHWSIEQLLSKSVELRQQNAGQPLS